MYGKSVYCAVRLPAKLAGAAAALVLADRKAMEGASGYGYAPRLTLSGFVRWSVRVAVMRAEKEAKARREFFRFGDH